MAGFSTLILPLARLFADDDEQASYLPALARASDLEWAPPGFKAFDTGDGASVTDSAEAPATDDESDAERAFGPEDSLHNCNRAQAAPVNGGDPASSVFFRWSSA